MPDLSAMWYCPTCETWNGTKLDRCLGCERERPRVPVTSDDVPVDDSRDVTLAMRARAKAGRIFS
jgi:hypothetical protein